MTHTTEDIMDTITYREDRYSDGSPRSVCIVRTVDRETLREVKTSETTTTKKSSWGHSVTEAPRGDDAKLASLIRECAGYEAHPEWYQDRKGAWTMNVQKSFDALAALRAKMEQE